MKLSITTKPTVKFTQFCSLIFSIILDTTNQKNRKNNQKLGKFTKPNKIAKLKLPKKYFLI